MGSRTEPADSIQERGKNSHKTCRTGESHWIAYRERSSGAEEQHGGGVGVRGKGEPRGAARRRVSPPHTAVEIGVRIGGLAGVAPLL